MTVTICNKVLLILLQLFFPHGSLFKSGATFSFGISNLLTQPKRTITLIEIKLIKQFLMIYYIIQYTLRISIADS